MRKFFFALGSLILAIGYFTHDAGVSAFSFLPFLGAMVYDPDD